MQVSRNALQSYPQLAGQNNSYYFRTRNERNAYFSNTASISVGQLCAVGGDPTSNNWEMPEWEAELYNGTNWEVVGLDSNFALIVTNEGIKALANASNGTYKFELSRIAIKQTSVGAGVDVAAWTKDNFLYPYTDICLDTYNIGNTTFTIANNISSRTNLLNGGLQFTLSLGLDCIGQKLATPTTNSTPTETEFEVAVIGLFVYNQTSGGEVLFAVANLPGPVEKVATTPTRIGNMLKFYLNTTLSNLSTVINTTTVMDSVNSVPEVQTDDDITDTYDGVHSPYNLYLVDNYSGTNIPAIAVRKGSDLSTDTPIRWTYFTPTDDTLDVSSDNIGASLSNYMIAAWDTTEEKYVAADGKNTDRTQQLTGLYTTNSIIYAGTVTNQAVPYSYAVTLNNTNAAGYAPGQTVYYRATNASNQSVLFAIHILTIDVDSGKPDVPYYITPATGSTLLSLSGNYPLYNNTECTDPDSKGLMLTSITSVENTNIVWNFPVSWIDKPLYADYDHSGESSTVWNNYCTNVLELAPDSPERQQRNRCGLFTIAETLMFVGWCLGSNSIRLALDLRNEATYATYGTTRYATQAEVNDIAHAGDAPEVTAVTPKELKANYFQINAPLGNTGDYYIQDSTHAGPVVVDSYTKFNHTIIGSGMSAPSTWNDSISFYGMSYRAMWADLAEYYKSDRVYPGGTLICFGSGVNEITMAKTECNGIISTKPGYQLGEKNTELDLPVALCGRVPVLFAQDCVPQFGDRIYLSKTTPGKASTVPNGKCLGKIIDKSEHLDQKLSIMCVVKIEF